MKLRAILAISGLLALAALTASFSLKLSHEKEKGESFLQFLSYFPKANLPLEIGLDDMENYAAFRQGFAKQTRSQAPIKFRASSISTSRFIPGAAESKFSRGGPPDLEPVSRFYPNEQMVAVIYRHAFDARNMNPYQTYFLVLYDLKGNILPAENTKTKKGGRQNKQFVVASSSDLKTVTCRIDEKGVVWQNAYDNVWKKDVREEGYLGNQLTDFTLAETKAYQISSAGVAETQLYASTSRASLDK